MEKHKRLKILRTRYHDIQRYATLNNAVLAIAMFIALGWVWGSVDALGRNYKYQQQVDANKAEVELISLQNDNLKAEQSYLGSNEYLELAARAKLNKALPGEKLVVLPSTSPAAVGMGSSGTVAPVESNLAQWMDFLFGKRSPSGKG